MFSKIPEISLNSAQASGQSVSLNRSQGKTSSQQTKLGTGQQIKPGTGQQIKPGTGQQNIVAQKDLPTGPLKNKDQSISEQTISEQTKSALNPNPGSGKASGTNPKTSFKETNQISASIVEELDTSVNRVSGLDGAIVQARRYSSTSSGRTKSPDLSTPLNTKVLVDQSPRRFSVTSLPSTEQPQTRRSSLSKATSVVAANERLTDQYLRRMSMTSSHSAERRFSSSSPRSWTEFGQDEARRTGMESSQQRRRPSRESRRRSSLILVGSNFRVGRKIGAGNFGEIRLGMNVFNTVQNLCFNSVYSWSHLICTLFSCLAHDINIIIDIQPCNL